MRNAEQADRVYGGDAPSGNRVGKSQDLIAAMDVHRD